MVLPTLFSAHAPAIQHRARRDAAGVPAPAVTLSPLDAFLLTRFAGYLPRPLTVLDLAADATDGDSVAVLDAAGVSVVSPRLSWAPPVSADWRPLVREERGARNSTHGAAPLAATASLTLLDAPADDGAEAWQTVARTLPVGGTTLVLLAETSATAPHTGQHLAWLADRLPDAPIVLLPLGATGTGEVLAQAMAACPVGGARRLIALREQAPFFATSELGLIFPTEDAAVAVALERLTALVTGNFQFLSLVRDAVTAATRIAALEAELIKERENYARLNERLVMTEAARVATDEARLATDEARLATDEARLATEEALRRAELARAQAEEARRQADSSRVVMERLLVKVQAQAEAALRASQAFEQRLAEKTEYAEWLESRLNHLEEEQLPWKNAVLARLEAEIRNLNASKALRAERLLRRVLRRG